MGLVSTRSPIADTEGLSQHEMALLVSIAQYINDPQETVSTYTIRQDMSKAGFAPIAVTLGLNSLTNKGFVQFTEESDRDGDVYKAYKVTYQGMDWLHNNIDKLVLRQEYIAVPKAKDPFNDDDLPF